MFLRRRPPGSSRSDTVSRVLFVHERTADNITSTELKRIDLLEKRIATLGFELRVIKQQTMQNFVGGEDEID